jgi:hypothetical protein
MTFDAKHNEAFRELGALAPGQQWSSFDCLRPDARSGKAKLFVTTVWNYHSKIVNGKRVPTEIAVCRDGREDSLWYMVSRPKKDARKTHVAHWDGIELAVKESLPMIGVLKDVRTGLCSMSTIFDIPEVRYQVDRLAMWLRLVPRAPVHCAVRAIDIEAILKRY